MSEIGPVDRAASGKGTEPNRVYPLPFETEDAKRRLTVRIEERLSKWRVERNPEYDAEFKRLGISPEAAEIIKDHRWKVARASNEVMAYEQQYLKAQADYDKMMRSTLSPESYAQYRRFEDQPAARLEIEYLKRFLGKTGRTLSDEVASEIRELLLDTRAFTFEVLHGPYDSMPQVGYGFEAGIASFNDDIVRIQNAKARLHPRFANSNLPADVRKYLDEYFQDRLRESESKIERLRQRIEARAGLAKPSSVGAEE